MKRIILSLLLLSSYAFGATFDQIPYSLTLGAGQSIRRNAGDSAFEAFTPLATGSVLFTDLGFTGSNITSIATRNYSDLQGLPTLFTQANADALYSALGHTHSFASLTSKPTTLSGYGITDAQPLDSDLTAVAALATDSFGRGLLTKTSAANVRTYIGAGTSSFDGAFSSLSGTPTTLAGYGITDAQSLDTQLTSLAALSYTGNTLKVVRVNAGETGFELATVTGGTTVFNDLDFTASNITSIETRSYNDLQDLPTLFTQGDADLLYVPLTRTVNGHALSSNVTVTPTDLSLVIGTNTQAWDTDLDTWATKTPYAGSVVVTTGKTFTDTNTLTLSGTDGSTLNVGTGGTLGTNAYTSTAYVPTTTTVNGHALSGNVTVTPTDLTLVTGTDVEAWDADLDTWATKTPYAGSVVVTTGKTFTDTNNLTLSGTDGSTLDVGAGGTLGTAAYTASSAYQPIDSDLTSWAGVTRASGFDTFTTTPSSANLRGLLTDEDGTGAFLTTNGSAASLTSFPTFNQNTTGSAASLSITGQTALLTFTGPTSTNRAKAVRDAADTILELGGSYTPSGTWTNMALVTPALGTPSALVLTNATGTPASIGLANGTGLPVSGITSSTSTALGVGSLELGNASDCTLGRGVTARLTVEGINVGMLSDDLSSFATTTANPIGVGSINLGHASDTTISRASSGVIAVEGVNVLLNGGALGTPSSGTATNITGLPISGLTSSTSTAIGVGSIELGHASDTTITRVSGGVVAVEGINLLLTGGALGTPSSGTLDNCTFPTLNQNTTGSAVYWKTSGTGKGSITGPATGTTRSYTFPDADSTMLYSGGALGTPSSGTLTNCTFPTLNQDTTGSAVGWKTSGTGKGLITGPATGTTRTYTFPDADATVARTDAANTFTGVQTMTSPVFTTPVLGTPTSGTMTNVTGTADGLTAGDVTRNHGVYAGASPPTVDVGVFTISKTGVDLKSAGTTTIFTVPSGRTFVCTGAFAVVTSITSAGAGTETFKIQASTGSIAMTVNTASTSTTPSVGKMYYEQIVPSSGPFGTAPAADNVQIVVTASQAGSTAVTGTVFVQGFYSG